MPNISRRLRTLSIVLGALACFAPAQDSTLWMKLWNGKNLDGWGYLPQFWKTDSGMIVGRGKATFNTFCHTQKTYGDFVLSVRGRLWETSPAYINSGVQYRSKVTDEAKHIVKGYQFEIGQGNDGALYGEGGIPAGVGFQTSTPECKAVVRTNDWNHFLITADGTKTRHQVNGVTCIEYTSTVPEGVVGLQMHATTVVMEVDFKDIYIRPLNHSFVIPDSLAVRLDKSYTVGIDPQPFRIGRTADIPAFRIDALGRVLPIPRNVTPDPFLAPFGSMDRIRVPVLVP